MITPLIPSVLGMIEGIPYSILSILIFSGFAIGLLITNELRRHRRDTQNQQTIPITSELQQALESVESQTRALKGFLEDPSKFNSSNIPTERVLNFVYRIKEAREKYEGENIPVKIIALQEHMEFAKLLVPVFHMFGYEVLHDKESATYIFAVKHRHDLIKVRFRETKDGKRSLAYVYLSGALRLSYAFEEDPFPSQSDIDYFQIELGGAP